MKDVHTARTLADAYVVRDALQRAGISASIRNEHLVNTPGIMPINETWPRVSVGDDHVEEARILLADLVRTDEGALALETATTAAGGDDEGAAALAVQLRGALDGLV
jgi:hypothetical protein